jgi:hypothetical protein
MTKEDILKQCIVNGNIVKLPEGHLERKLYQEVAKSLELIGGKWKGGKTLGFVFQEDPTELLYEITNGEKRNLKKEFQFFETPENLADKLVCYADLKQDDTILEPSAGQGAIIKSINKICDIVPDCYELMPVNAHILNKSNLKFNLIGNDFLLNKGKQYTKIIANPPFSKNQDIDHIKMMYNCLKKGGKLVSIASNHWRLSNNKKETNFKNWLFDINALIIDVDAKAFQESGTMISTCIIIINN